MMLHCLWCCLIEDVVIKYPKFASTGFIAFPRPRPTRREFDVDIQFRPDSVDGLLLFVADDVHVRGRFFSVALVRGRVQFRYFCISLSVSLISCKRDPQKKFHISLSAIILRCFLASACCDTVGYQEGNLIRKNFPLTVHKSFSK